MLQPGLAISGSVVDPNFGPVDGATVLPFPSQGPDLATTSAADGSFAYDQLSSEVEGFLISHPDYARGVVALDGSTAFAMLEPGLTLSGSLLEAASGNPVEGTVTLHRPAPEGELDAGDHPDWIELETSAGAWTQDHLLPGNYQVQVTSPGYLPSTQFLTVDYGPDPVVTDLHLEGSASLDVLVVDELGLPIPQVQICCYDPASQFLTFSETDDQGKFLLPSVPNIPLHLRLVHGDYLSHSEDGLVPNVPATLTLQSDPNVAPTGTVKVSLLPGGGVSPKAFWAVLRSDQETYRLGDPTQPLGGSTGSLQVRPGVYEVLAVSQGAAGMTQVTVASGSTVSAQLQLEEGRSLNLTHTGPSDARVAVFWREVELASAVATQDAGTVLGAFPAEADLVAQAQWDGDQAWARVPAVPVDSVPPGGMLTPVTMDPAASGHLQLNFELAEGEPASGVQVRLIQDRPNPAVFTGYADEEGTFSAESLPTGYSIVENGLIFSGQQFWWTGEAVLVSAGSQTSLTALTTTTNENGEEISEEHLEQETCGCHWVPIPVSHDPEGASILHRVNNSDKYELAARRAAGGAAHATGARIRIKGSFWTSWGLFGLGYHTATANGASSGSSDGGVELASECVNCAPSITGKIKVEIEMSTDAGNLIGAVGHVRGQAAATVNVTGDLSETMAPGSGASTECGVGSSSTNLSLGGTDVPIPSGSCHADSKDFSGSAGPTTVNKSTFEIIGNANHESRALGWAMAGNAMGKTYSGSTFTIVRARCLGKCNHIGGCPTLSGHVVWETTR